MIRTFPRNAMIDRGTFTDNMIIFACDLMRSGAQPVKFTTSIFFPFVRILQRRSFHFSTELDKKVFGKVLFLRERKKDLEQKVIKHSKGCLMIFVH